jgi:ABC-2 type transport system ATP-binding protein
LTEIVAAGVVKRFDGRAVVDRVDLVVPSGTLCGLVGADGAGKTTLLRCIAGLYRVDEGCVAPGSDGQHLIGFAQQGFHLYGDLTVDENVRFFGALYGVGPATLAERAHELLRFAGLADRRASLAGELSGGLKQRLMLVCALLHQPSVLLLDEPTTGVDPLARREFWDLVAHLHARGSTILVASAYFDEVERCDQIVYLRHGRVRAAGTPTELRGPHASLEEAVVAAER